jgi:GNAT superfamily N-acetyltransferase
MKLIGIDKKGRTGSHLEFELLEWESKESALPYYVGDALESIKSTNVLSSGIYIIKGCKDISSLYLATQGWEYLMGITTLEIIRGDKQDTTSSVWAERLKQYSWNNKIKDGLVESAVDIFDNPRCYNRLYRTLEKEIADRLMIDWTKNSLYNRSKRIGVVRRSDGTAGFITVREESSDIDRIDLLGVKPNYRRQGWGTALAAWAVETMEKPLLRVRTESDNIASIKAYKSVGFREVVTDTLFWTKVGE